MKKTICIDPGHGGHDPGAVGFKREEEDVVVSPESAAGGLGVSERLAHHLRAKGYDVILTRTDDTFIQLSERAKIARRNHADLFVSLHCNSATSSAAHGIEAIVYPEQFHGEADLARDILSRIHKQPKGLSLVNRGVKKRRLAVLSGTYNEMPAVLVELPFISNKAENELLFDREFREEASVAIADAVDAFLR